MKLAFYAPLKGPDHPTPSGDRNVARGLIAALAGLGAEVTIASTLRSRDGVGRVDVQAQIMAQAKAQLPDLIARGKAEGWRGWITYHNYYKAPDLLGPQVSAALGIPYLLVEATRAQSRLTGPWADFAAAAEAATDAADVVFYFTQQDQFALERDAVAGQHLRQLRPFLNVTSLPPLPTSAGPFLSVGMMRVGDKLASYQIITEVLSLLDPGTWHLNIAGDGPARAQVESMMRPFGDSVRFLGALDGPALAAAYQGASCLFWPGVNEAFGLSYLEAQLAGLPVVAQDRPGVRDVLAPGRYPSPQSGVAPLAAMLKTYQNDPIARAKAAEQAQAYVGAHHLLGGAQACLRAGLKDVGVAL